MKHINLENSYRIILTDKKGKDFTQYIEAEDMDEAIRKAKNTFEASLREFKEGSTAQKACNKTIIKERLRFGFCGGWITIGGGRDIFTMLDEAINHNFVAGADITEIMPALT